MLNRDCVVKYVDTLGIEHAVKVEAESLFQAAIRGLQRLDSSVGADAWDRMSITVEVYAEPTTYTGLVQKLKQRLISQEGHAQEVKSLQAPETLLRPHPIRQNRRVSLGGRS